MVDALGRFRGPLTSFRRPPQGGEPPATRKAPRKRGFFFVRNLSNGLSRERLLLEAETGELVVEAGQTAAAIEQLLGATGPSRVRVRVDVELHRVAVLAPGGAGLELGAIGHDDLDRVVIGMNLGLHGPVLGSPEHPFKAAGPGASLALR